MKKMGGPSGTWARREMCTRFWLENYKKSNHLENLGEKGRMMLK